MSIRRGALALAGLAFVSLLAPAAQAQPFRDNAAIPGRAPLDPGPLTTNTPVGPGRAPLDARPVITQPRFMAHPVSIYANDETGLDWWTSDEVFAVFRDPATGSRVRTAQWNGVDTGDTRYFSQANACIAPLGAPYTDGDGDAVAWSCREGGAPGPFAFRVELYEAEHFSLTGACSSDPSDIVDTCADYLIGAADFSFTQAELLAAMPRVDDYYGASVRLGGYTFVYRIYRLPDVFIEH